MMPQKFNFLTHETFQVVDNSTRKIYHLNIQPKITALESANLAFLFAMMRSSGGYDWWEFIQAKKLEKHFTEVI